MGSCERSCQPVSYHTPPPEDKGQYGFSGPIGPPAALSPLPAAPAEGNNAVSADFGRWQAYCPLSAAGIVARWL